MVNGLKFPSRLLASNHQGHWNEGRAALWMAVEACRGNPRRDRKRAKQFKRNSSGVDRREKLSVEHADVRTGNRHRWVRRVASGERVKRGQGTRHNDPVTSEEGMSELVSGTNELVRIAVNRPKRLFSKNTGACQAA